MAISGLTNPVMALATGDIEVDGGNTDFLKFLTYFQ
jgi:putative sterol carrier protein